MTLYRQDSTGFMCEFTGSPPSGYTAVSAMPGDTAGRISWWRSRCVDSSLGQSSVWHPSLSGSLENAWGVSGDGKNRMPTKYAPITVDVDTYPSELPLYDAGALIVFGANSDTASIISPQKGLQVISFDASLSGYFGSSATDYNISLDAGYRWIVSCFCRPLQNNAAQFKLRLKTAAGTYESGTFTNVNVYSRWSRFSYVADLSADSSSSAILGIRPLAIAGTGGVVLDGLMVEKQIGYGSDPSPFSSGS